MNERSMAGWIGFAGILMVLLGGLSVFEGLIALLEDNYYVVTPSGYLLFDITAWGWIMLIWGLILALVGLALLGRRKLGALGRDPARQHQRVQPTRLSRQHERHRLAADHADAQHHRPVRPDCPMAREPAGTANPLRTPNSWPRVIGRAGPALWSRASTSLRPGSDCSYRRSAGVHGVAHPCLRGIGRSCSCGLGAAKSLPTSVNPAIGAVVRGAPDLLWPLLSTNPTKATVPACGTPPR